MQQLFFLLLVKILVNFSEDSNALYALKRNFWINVIDLVLNRNILLMLYFIDNG